MAHLFRIDSSIQGDNSVSRAVADSFQAAWTQVHPEGTVTTRDFAVEPLPYISATSQFARFTAEEDRSPEQRAAVERTTGLFDELLAADVVLLAVPLYNWGVPATVKTWLDHLLTDPRVADGLAGRTVVVVSARGGSYRPGAPREGWDHIEPYLRNVLADHLQLDLRVITPEFTLAEVVPAMAEFREDAQKSLAAAHETADRAARDLVAQLG
jgi:FMN-dependent NADH-azoreductase